MYCGVCGSGPGVGAGWRRFRASWGRCAVLCYWLGRQTDRRPDLQRSCLHRSSHRSCAVHVHRELTPNLVFCRHCAQFCWPGKIKQCNVGGVLTLGSFESYREWVLKATRKRVNVSGGVCVELELNWKQINGSRALFLRVDANSVQIIGRNQS